MIKEIGKLNTKTTNLRLAFFGALLGIFSALIAAPAANATVTAGLTSELFWTVYELSGPDVEGTIAIETVDLSNDGNMDGNADAINFTFTNESTGTASGSIIQKIYMEGDTSGGGFDAWLTLTGSFGDEGLNVDYTFGGQGPANPVGTLPGDPYLGNWVTFGIDNGGDGFDNVEAANNNDAGINVGGLAAGEWVTVTFFLDDALAFTLSDWNDLLDEIINGTARISAHVLECLPGNSCGVYAQPIPGAIWLFVSALAGLVGIGYRRRRVAAA